MKEALYYNNMVYATHARLIKKDGTVIASGYFSSVEEAEEKFQPKGTKMLQINLNTHKFRVLKAYNGNTFIASGFKHAEHIKSCLKDRVKLIRVI